VHKKYGNKRALKTPSAMEGELGKTTSRAESLDNAAKRKKTRPRPPPEKKKDSDRRTKL
jgi:hypothetical protein